MERFLDALRIGPVLLMDGAIGTELQRAGVEDGACYELRNLTHPEQVRTLHQAYIDAGARVLLTNTFQANPVALARFGIQDLLEEVNQAAVRIARSVAGPNRFVLGSVGPVGAGPTDRDATLDALARVVRSLRGVDALLFETWSDLDFLDDLHHLPIPSQVPVLMSFTYRPASTPGAWQLHTGPEPGTVAVRCHGRITALGVNCGLDLGMDAIGHILRRYREATDLPLFARPNAGTPTRVDEGWRYPLEPNDMAAALPDLLAAGVRMIGGCCGTTPAHIAAMRGGLSSSAFTSEETVRASCFVQLPLPEFSIFRRNRLTGIVNMPGAAFRPAVEAGRGCGLASAMTRPDSSPPCLHEIAMPRRIHLYMLAVFAGFLAAPGGLRAQFIGAFADGTRIKDAQLVTGPDGKEPPRLVEAEAPKGRDLGSVFDAKNPVSWLFNQRAEEPLPPRPCVECFGGDRLPGQVVGYRYGTENPAERLAAHLLVKLDPDAVLSPHALVRVRASAVRKVVWQPRRVNRYVPSSLYLLDDRHIPFRALRWTAEGVTLLLNEGGTRNVAFGEIAELHLPRVDPWRAYLETLAILTPACSARIMRVETSRGLVLTGTMERSQASTAAHLFQPAWSLEPVGFAPRHLRWWRFFQPHEVPLAIIEPLRAEQRSPLGGGRTWQADQNVKLQPLTSGGKIYGGGFGMQSDAELEFELPTTIRGFRALVGMDELAGRGGCGRGRIHANRSAEPALWQSKVFVGSGDVTPTGFVPLKGPAGGQKSLILVAEAPTADRPAEADPLNIRSFVDWLEPRLELDLDLLRAEVERLVPETIPAWQGWTASTIGGGKFRAAQRWDVHEAARPLFRRDIVVPRDGLRLTRQLEVGPNQGYLCLAVSREPDTPEVWVEVRIDGRPAAEWAVPAWERTPTGQWFAPSLAFVPLTRHQGKSIKVEVDHYPSAEGGTIEWRGLELVPSPSLASWTPVNVVEAKASAPETTLVSEPAAAFYAAIKDPRKPPKTDSFTIIADTDLTDISAFRLELLADPRLPNGGPGRGDGHVFLSEFKVTAAPRDRPDQAEPVALTAAGTDHYQDHLPASAVDGKPETGWLAIPYGRTHVIVFTAAQNVSFPGGSRLTFSLEQHLAADRTQGGRSPGRFRLLVTGAPKPVPMARPGVVLEPPGRKTLFEDEYDFVNQLRLGLGAVNLESKDKYAGSAALQVTGTRQHSKFLGEIRIRREPGRGEYRYLQFAWKKTGGQAVGLQLAHDKEFGPIPPAVTPFRYHAGPGSPWADRSVRVSENLPVDWVLVTRDLFADFGEFTLTGLSLDALDGSHALFDRIRLGRTAQDFE